MKMDKEILQKDAKVLRKKAKEIPLKEITSPKIQKILKEMSLALGDQDDGVAIAAPQIGYSLRIFLISSKILRPGFEEERMKNIEIGKKYKTKKDVVLKDLIFINPKISNLSKAKHWIPEGCLSVRPLYGLTHRHKKATITAYDETGKKFTRGGSGLWAQIFQHETDHLKGILFIDHAKEIREDPNWKDGN